MIALWFRGGYLYTVDGKKYGNVYIDAMFNVCLSRTILGGGRKGLEIVVSSTHAVIVFDSNFYFDKSRRHHPITAQESGLKRLPALTESK